MNADRGHKTTFFSHFKKVKNYFSLPNNRLSNYSLWVSRTYPRKKGDLVRSGQIKFPDLTTS